MPYSYKKEDLFRLDAHLKNVEGLTKVYIDFEENSQKVLIKTPHRTAINTALINFLEETFGPESWDFEIK